MAYKAKVAFSFDTKVYQEGDAVNVDDGNADTLLKRGLIVEGKGKVQPTEIEKIQAENEKVEKMSTKVDAAKEAEKKDLGANPGASMKVDDQTKGKATVGKAKGKGK